MENGASETVVSDSERTMFSKTQNETQIQDSSNLITDHREILDMVLEVLDEAQHTRPKKSLINQMVEIRKKCHPKFLPRILFRALIQVVAAEKRTEYVDNIMDFVFKTTMEIEKSETEGEITHDGSFLEAILRCCVKYHSDERTAVRCNVTHLCARLLDSVVTFEDFDEKLMSKLKDLIWHRTRDKSAQVRAYDLFGSTNFQSQDDPFNCKVTEVLINRVKYDPNFEVRKAALKAMNPNERTLRYIVEKVSDVNEAVRMAAHYNIGKKVAMDQIAVDAREQILELGLTETSSKVKKRAAFVVEEWLSSYDNNVITFLSKLDVISKKKVCYLALNNIFRERNTKYFEKVDKSFWGEDKLIPYEKLDEEVAFYWKYVLARFCSIPLCAELLMPTVHDICQYILKYMEDFDEKYEDSHDASVLAELLEVLMITSKSMEEGGRIEIRHFIQTAFHFKHLKKSHVRILMQLFYNIHIENVDEEFFEIIRNMMESCRCRSVTESKSAPKNKDEVVLPAPSGPTDDELYAMKLELANLIHERHKLIRDKDEAVIDNNFLKAHEFQLKVDDLAERAEVIRAKVNRNQVDANNKGESDSEQKQREEAEEEEEQEQLLPDKYPVHILEPMLVAFYEHVLRQSVISNAARTFYQTFVSNAIVCESDLVRQYVLKIMTIIGLHTFDKHGLISMQYCLQALTFDSDSVQHVAYRCIFDLLLHYGFDQFGDRKIQNFVSSNVSIADISMSLREDQGPTLRMLLMDQLNSEDSKLVKIGATGIMKLSLAGRLCSMKCTIRLLLIWINPINDGTKFANSITKFFPLFAKKGLKEALVIADAVVPTVVKILNANSTSPLVDASPEKLFAFVASGTKSEDLESYMETPEAVHERIANNIMDYMLSVGPSSDSFTFAKGLKFLNLHGCNAKSLKIILKKIARLLKILNNRNASLSLTAFMKHLNAELLMVEDKQITADDTASFRSESDSEESVHISDRSSPELFASDDEGDENEDFMDENKENRDS